MVGSGRGGRAASNSPILGPIDGIGNVMGYPLRSPVRGRILLILAAARGFRRRRHDIAPQRGGPRGPILAFAAPPRDLGGRRW